MPTSRGGIDTRDLLEAGRIDGASDLRIFFSVGSRLMLPGLVTAFLAQFVGIWNNFLLPLVMLQNQRLYPLTLGFDTWQGQDEPPSDPADAHTGRIRHIYRSPRGGVPILATLLEVRLGDRRCQGIMWR